jgi:hypothetical protein
MAGIGEEAIMALLRDSSGINQEGLRKTATNLSPELRLEFEPRVTS